MKRGTYVGLHKFSPTYVLSPLRYYAFPRVHFRACHFRAWLSGSG